MYSAPAQGDDQELTSARDSLEAGGRALFVDRPVRAEPVEAGGFVAQVEAGDGVRRGPGKAEGDRFRRGAVGQGEHPCELPALRFRITDPDRVPRRDQPARRPSPGARPLRPGHRNRRLAVVGAVRLDVAHEVLPGVRLVGRGRGAQRHLGVPALARLGVLGQHDARGQRGGHDAVPRVDLVAGRRCRGPAGEENVAVGAAGAVRRMDVADDLRPLGQVGLVEAQRHGDTQAGAHDGFPSCTRRKTGRTVTGLVRTSWSPRCASKT